MLIVNDKLKLGGGFFSETFLGYFIDDENGESREVIAKQVTSQAILNQIVKETQQRKQDDLLKENESNTNYNNSKFNEKKNLLLNLLERESQIAKFLSHPNIIKMIGYQKFKGVPSILYEYADSGTLALKMRRKKLFSIEEIIDFLTQAIDGLSYIHCFEGHNSLIHMDINPDNIFFFSDGKIKIGDFGLTIKSFPEIINEKILYKTKNLSYSNIIYASPEILHSKVAYQSSDLWSLGIILYQLISGKEPKLGNKYLNIFSEDKNKRKKAINYIINDIRKVYSNKNIKVVDELIYIIKQMMSTPENTKFQSAVDLKNYLNFLEKNKNSAFGKLTKKVNKYHQYLLNINLQNNKIVDYFYNLNETFIENHNPINTINILEELFSSKIKIKELKDNFIKALSVLNIKNKRNNYEFLDFALGKSYYQYAVQYYYLLVKINKTFKSDNFNEEEKNKYLELFSNNLIDLKKLLQETINCFRQALDINIYCSDCLYLLTKSIFLISEIDIFYLKDIDTVSIVANCTEYMLMFVEKIQDRPSFNNFFNIEKLIIVFSNIMQPILDTVSRFIDIINSEELDVEEKEIKSMELLKDLKIYNCDVQDDTSFNLINKNFIDMQKKIIQFNSIRSRLYNFMFESLMN